MLNPTTNFPKLEPFVICVPNAISIQMNSPARTHPPATARRETRLPARCRGRSPCPSTPLSPWTFYINDQKHHHPHNHHSSSGARDVKLSARKLAAGFWQLRLLRRGYGGVGSKHGSSDRSGNGNAIARASMMFSQKQTIRKGGLESDTKHQIWGSQSTVRYGETSIEAYCFITHMKLLEDQVKTMSFVSALRAELMQAQVQIHNLESEVLSCKKTIQYLLRKLEVERMSQQKKELHDNVYALIDDLKGQFNRERKRRQKMEIINSQLVKELAGAKLSAMELIQKYEEEKRTRELIEVVCDELAKKIGEDKVEVEDLRVETMKIRQELEQEREMLQMAEVWREERVQIKLLDAKLALESKYSQLNHLITALEAFLKSRSTSLDVTELRTAEMIAEAVKSITSTRDMEEFSYESLRSGDILSMFEELLQVEVSNYQPVSPEENDHAPTHSGGFNGTQEVNRSHERVNNGKNMSSGCSIEEIDSSIITMGGCRNAPSCEIECDEIPSRYSSDTEISQVCSISADRSNQKTSSAKTYSNRKPVKVRVRHENSMEHWSSSDMANPHIARGMKGSIEWPRGFQKNSLKAKMFEANYQLQRDSID